MRTSFHRRVATIVLVVTMAAIPLAVAKDQAPAPEKAINPANVLIIVRIGKLENGKRNPVKTYSLVVADGTRGSRLLSGRRVPFPGDGVVYQNIGFSTNAEAWIVDKKTIQLVAQIEDSRVVESQGGAPIVETRQLEVNAMLTDGVPLELTRVEGVTDPSGFVEVEARILRQGD